MSDAALAVIDRLVRPDRGGPDPVHSCGACTLCCTVMRVDMGPPKPEYVTCQHCTGRSCGIYADRPEPCHDFQCLWLASQQMRATAMDPALRPDRCGVAIDLNAVGTLMAHCARPGSWQREPIRSWLLEQARYTNVVLELPTGAELLAPDGSTRKLRKVGVHESGNRLYAFADDLPADEAAA